MTVLLGAYGPAGEKYLPAQLESLAAQSHAAWSVIVSDDSAPLLEGVVADFAKGREGQVSYRAGPKSGFARNFMQLLAAAPEGALAFCDQDDVWAADKLARAVAALSGIEGPALYSARVMFWNGETRVEEPVWPRAPSFRNALIENVARGNTIVLNAEAAALMREVAGRVEDVFAHDWLTYLMVAGAGGQVICDAGPPVLDYRQHDEAELGSGAGLRAQMSRKGLVLKGAFRDRMQSNVTAMSACSDLLTPENQEVLRRFSDARRAGWAGLPALASLGLYRQRPLGTLGFWGATLLGRA